MRQESVSDSLVEDDGGGDWIVTYSDLVTLLLVFFILLYSMSSLNVEKFKEVIESIRINLGDPKTAVGMLEILDVPDYSGQSIEQVTGMNARDRKTEILRDISSFVAEKRMGENIVVLAQDNRIVIRIRGKVMFRSGLADLNPEAYPILDEIIKVIREYDEYSVNIKGYTDNIPISTRQFPSNWELSAVRATTVLKYLIAEGVSPERMTATGYGALLPLVPNDTEQRRAANRRVEFVLERKN